MIDTGTQFNDLGVDATTGLVLLENLGVRPDELVDPRRFQQMKDVIDYLKQFPEDTQRFFINKATLGKNVDKLQHMYEYTDLLKRKGELDAEVKALEAEREATRSGDEMLKENVKNRLLMAKKSLRAVSNEVSIYEK